MITMPVATAVPPMNNAEYNHGIMGKYEKVGRPDLFWIFLEKLHGVEREYRHFIFLSLGPNVEITLSSSTTPDLDVRTLILSLGQLKANLPMVVRDHDLLFLDLFLKSIGLQRLFKICQGVTTALESGWHSASDDASNISHQLCRYA